ncbi:MAG: hypothetical protein D6701_01175, partial [Gemmatimonadetes bacterium]
MIVRRYGSAYHSVEPDFDSRALTEIGFRRDRRWSMPAEEFEAGMAKGEEHALTAQAEGYVQDEVESHALTRLREQLDELLASLPEGALLVVESEQGVDYPKTRGKQTNVVIEGENRLHFETRIDPPLRLG